MSNHAEQSPRSETGSPKADKILEAAQHIFAGCGYGTASMDAIAAEAGVSKATVYAHFSSKERLFAAMARSECKRFMAQMEIPANVEQLALRPALTHIARNFLELALTPRILSICRVVIAESRRFPELGPIFYESGPKVTLNGLTSYLDTARAHGMIETDSPRLSAYQFLGMLRGDLQLRALIGIDSPTPATIKRVADRAVDVFLRAYQKP
jgi:TetR/AcrR family transcriptional repressor of mexJK operon